MPRKLKNKVRLAATRGMKSSCLRGALLVSVGAAAVPVMERVALAQLQLGQIQGTVTAKDTDKPLAGVTVVVSGPALQGDQTEVTDNKGKYQITQLPSGDNYVVRFYFNDVVVERPNVRITQNKSLTISLAIPTHKAGRDVYVVRERAPVIDTASANTGVEINQEILQNTAVRGRTYESAMSLAPGSADVSPRAQAGGDVGVSFGGSTGNENALVIDGLNTTDLNSGVLSTQLHQYFIKELNVITGGYQAEYGRATGGVVSILTKSGSNEFHGGVFGSISPWQAEAQTVARLGEALATRSRQLSQYDFGFELGGPIVKDRIWFYVGFAPTFTTNRTDRIVRTQSSSGMLGSNGMFSAQRDPSYLPPDYLSSVELSRGLDTLALKTTEVSSTQIDETQRIYNWIAKLQFNINPDHNITVGYIGAPEFNNEYIGLRNDVNAVHRDRAQQVHDGTFHYVGKLIERKLQVDVIYGYHYQGRSDTPYALDKNNVVYRAAAANPYSLADFEQVPGCARTIDQTTGKATFNPCPITNYQYGGYGQYIPNQVLQRHAIQSSGTLFVKAGGTHAIKLGFDFEDNLSDNTRKYTGVDFDPSNPYFIGRLNYQTDGAGEQLRVNRGYGLPIDKNVFGDAGVPCAAGIWCYNYFRAVTESRNYAVYLRDSWNIDIGKLKGLTVNGGVRWEAQEIMGSDGSKQIAIYDQVSPRFGLAWDPSQKGRGKIFANYGRFYETVPMDINDRAFSGEGLLVGRAFTGDCTRRTLTKDGIGMPVQVPEASPGSPCRLTDPRVSGGGVYAPVAPGIKGQHQDEVVVGGQIDIGLDIVVGAYYTYRTLGSIIEDLSVNGGSTFFIANPGAQADPKVAAELDAEAKRKQAMLDSTPMGDPNTPQAAAYKKVADDAAAARNRADVYKAVSTFPKAQREYHAVTLTVNKRLSNRFSLLANYTYSRLWGNFPGPYNPYTNQLDPNISSQFDTINLTVNRNGPLNNDRPHNFKATGFFQQPVAGARGMVTASLTFTAISGRPIQTLGQDVVYGARQSFILPSGSAGRTPMITQLDMHLGYDHQLSDKFKLSLYGDVINLFNQRGVINVDDEYTTSNVNPILYGKPEDLRKLRSVEGGALVLNSNYGQPTAYQAPIYLRFGARLFF